LPPGRGRSRFHRGPEETTRATGDPRHQELALRLVEQVHATLGRHRPDDACSGWLSVDDDGLIAGLLAAALVGLRRYQQGGELDASAHLRLAFRELGLAVGLAALPVLDEALPRAAPRLAGETEAVRAQLIRLAPIRADIEAFWLESAHRRGPSWREHEDINDVMLATTLLPDGFLALRPVRR